MSMGLPAYTSVGSGTLQASASSTNVAASPNASTLPGDLVVMVCYVDQGAVNDEPRDAGDGWVVLGWRYDTTDADGLIMAACLAPRAGAAGYAGLTISSGAYLNQTHTYRLAEPAKFALGNWGGSVPIMNLASGTALDAPAINQPYPQVIDLVGRGYWNGGTTTTVGNITNFTERFDTGNTTQQMGVALNDRTAAITGSVQNPLVTSALAVAKVDRVGLRAMIPIIGNTRDKSGRMRGGRRLF